MTVLSTILLPGRSWLVPAVVFVAALTGAVIWAARRGAAERWVAMACGALKVGGIATLALCLLEPLWLSQRARPGANLFAVIADNSQSLQVKDEGRKLSRGELLREQLNSDPQGWQAALEKNFQVRRYWFDSRLQNTRDFAGLDFEGRASALGAALRSAVDRWRGQPVAGVLLFTDGNATDISGDLPALDGCPPIYPVVLGEDSGMRDIGIDKVTVSQTAFEDAPVTVQAEVGAHGFGGTDIRAQLTEIATVSTFSVTNTTVAQPPQFSVTSNAVAALSQRARGEDAGLNFRFQIQPDKTGIHFYQLETLAAKDAKRPEAAVDEATLANNRRLLVVDRGQEPFRILCVAGRPDPEYKFLNRAIEEDPQVRMVTLMRIARREPKFEFKGRAGEASNPLFRGFGAATNEETARYDEPVMIRLNTRDGFELQGGFPKTAAELFKYHAVILDRVEAGFFKQEQLLLLRRFVAERGGGFLMLGGAEAFREGGYSETPIAPMLPVYLDRPADVRLPGAFKFTLTPEGWLQPWMRLRNNEDDERKRLLEMPPFEVLNPIRSAKPGASVLATVSGDNHSYPALVVQRFGFGSVAALMVGDLRRWGMEDESMGEDLAKSWRQLVRWMVSDVPGRITVSTESTDDPSQVKLVVKARDEEFKPLDNAVVKLDIRPVSTLSPGTGSSGPPSGTNSLELAAEPSAVDPGKYEATYVVRNAGAYCVDAVVTQPDGEVAGRAAAGWTSDPASEEFRSLKPNRALLESLAKRTGGEVVAMKDLKNFARRLPERHAPVTEEVTDAMWHQPIVFLFVLGCFIAEWGLRRWKGLP